MTGAAVAGAAGADDDGGDDDEGGDEGEVDGADDACSVTVVVCVGVAVFVDDVHPAIPTSSAAATATSPNFLAFPMSDI